MNDPLITFTYETEKDIWCIANKGKSSNNSSQATKVYQLLESRYGENPTEENIKTFISEYLQERNVSTKACIQQYTDEWAIVSDEYHKRASGVFGVKLPKLVTAYLTINNRCPYNIAENLFYVSFPRESVRKTIMHELWHFYTWYGLGPEEEVRLGKERYNDYKEALTVLLNEVCTDLLPEGMTDEGYPQHQTLRGDILKHWQSDKDIHKLWDEITK